MLKPTGTVATVLFLILVNSPVVASVLTDALEGMENGRIYFSYETKPGVTGDGDTISMRDGYHHSTNRRGWSGDGWDCDCTEGPAYAMLRVRNGKVRGVDLRVAAQWRRPRDEDQQLGLIDPVVAADFMLELVGQEVPDTDTALLAAVVADREEPLGGELLELARDRSLRSETRKSVVFWLGHVAADKANNGLTEFIDDDTEEMDVRSSAVFAISQQDEDVSIPLLMKIAREQDHPRLRREALFWLAQYDRDEVVDLFEQLLLAD